jgi:hypothetical protein
MDVVMIGVHLLNQLAKNKDIITPYPFQILQQQN